jgi:hypothetical protein
MPKMSKLPKMPKIKDVNHYINKGPISSSSNLDTESKLINNPFYGILAGKEVIEKRSLILL